MKKFIPFALLPFLISCSPKQDADLIIHHAKVYTVDDKFSIVEAFVVKDGKIIDVGSSDNM
ncbi:MAG: amidohydrolase, partial [Phormidesmis sp. FL-bin-119]|nr:amidohydrolase [Pedobacter sp.]